MLLGCLNLGSCFPRGFFCPLLVFVIVYGCHAFFYSCGLCFTFILVLWHWLVDLQDLDCHIKLIVVIAVTISNYLCFDFFIDVGKLKSLAELS